MRSLGLSTRATSIEELSCLPQVSNMQSKADPSEPLRSACPQLTSRDTDTLCAALPFLYVACQRWRHALSEFELEEVIHQARNAKDMRDMQCQELIRRIDEGALSWTRVPCCALQIHQASTAMPAFR